ncbi:hypothetical protein PM082_021450 [Marasmius tenuissimus]|nr:hypothetical protein PM082_021450 [Marasmius tenuissimus]
MRKFKLTLPVHLVDQLPIAGYDRSTVLHAISFPTLDHLNFTTTVNSSSFFCLFASSGPLYWNDTREGDVFRCNQSIFSRESAKWP